MMGDNPRHSSCVNRSSTRSPTNRTQVPTSPQPLGDLCTPAFQIEEQLNGVYEKRIAEIEQQTDGDASLKEVTYVEWIEMLRQVNKTLIVNIQEMERETTERLSLLQRKVGSNCRFSQDSELNKYRNDVAGLMQLVRNGRRNADWSVDKLNFETITERDIFGNEASYSDLQVKSENETSNPACAADDKVNFECQKAKLTANIKALAFEVAEKHDEIRDLKKQILSMEDEIQKAQKKIQLKDDVIKELRNDLKSLPKCNNLWGVRVVERTASNLCTPKMSVKPGESIATDVSAVCRTVGEPHSDQESVCSLNCPSANASNVSLPVEPDEEEKLFKGLKEELSQLFNMLRNHDQNVDMQRQAVKDQQDRLNEMVEKLLKSNSDFQKMLNMYRRELEDVLQNPQSDRTLTKCSDVDSGICSDASGDVNLINSVREHFCCLHEENKRLRGEQQNMQIKFEDASSRAQGKSDLLDKTSKALREVVDALTNGLCQPISYEKIFEDCQNMSVNPVVEAVDELIESSKEKDKIILELRGQITNAGKVKQEMDALGTELRDANESV